MDVNNNELLDSVVHITEGRDRRSIIKALIRTISDLVELDAIIFLRQPRGDSNDYMEVAESLPVNIHQERFSPSLRYQAENIVQHDAGTLLAIKERRPLLEEFEGWQRVLFPVIVNSEISGIIAVYAPICTPGSRKVIQSLIRLYVNFITIIDDSEHDTLTGLLNRKTFDAQLMGLLDPGSGEGDEQVVLERRKEHIQSPNWIGILDIDHFKQVNDGYGHVFGDEVLLLFADLMKGQFRSTDLLFRYGGEEFVVVLAPTPEEHVDKVFERFRARLEAFPFPQIGQVTTSIGIVRLDNRVHPTTLIEFADKALYYAKEHGRNRVCNYHTLLSEGALTTQIVDEGDIELF